MTDFKWTGEREKQEKSVDTVCSDAVRAANAGQFVTPPRCLTCTFSSPAAYARV